jgi:hypothetical protein
MHLFSLQLRELVVLLLQVSLYILSYFICESYTPDSVTNMHDSGL